MHHEKDLIAWENMLHASTAQRTLSASYRSSWQSEQPLYSSSSALPAASLG